VGTVRHSPQEILGAGFLEDRQAPSGRRRAARQGPRASHEARVERFYSHGVERYGSFHDNYLNFGLWEPGCAIFVEAAEALTKEARRICVAQAGFQSPSERPGAARRE